MALSPKIPFKQEFIEDARRISRALPVTDKGFAKFFQVPRGTVRQWRREHPKFDEACRFDETTAIAGIIDNMLQQALDGNLNAQMFVLARRAGWTEKQSVDLTVTKSETEMTDAELRQIAAAGLRRHDGAGTTH